MLLVFNSPQLSSVSPHFCLLHCSLAEYYFVVVVPLSQLIFLQRKKEFLSNIHSITRKAWLWSVGSSSLCLDLFFFNFNSLVIFQKRSLKRSFFCVVIRKLTICEKTKKPKVWIVLLWFRAFSLVSSCFRRQHRRFEWKKKPKKKKRLKTDLNDVVKWI